MDLLLDKRNYQKIELIKYLSKQYEFISIDELCELLSLSKVAMRRVLDSLEEDLHELFNHTVKIDTNESYKYYLVIDSQYYKSANVINMLTLHYLKQSLSFQFLLTLFYTKYPSSNALMDELLISSSYFYKLNKNLSKILKKWYLELDFSINDSGFNYMGKTEYMRLFTYHFFWNSFKEQKWPFSKITLDTTKRYLATEPELVSPQLSLSKATRVEYFFKITMNMIVNEKKYVSLDKEYQDILTCIQDVHDLSEPMNQIFNNRPLVLPQDKKASEKLFFNFALRLILASIDSPSQRIEIGQKFLLLDNSSIDFNKKFFHRLLQFFNLTCSSTQYADMIYYVTLYFLAIEKLNINLLSFAREHPQVSWFGIDRIESKELSDSIKKFSNDFISEQPAYDSAYDTENNLDIMYNLVYFIISFLQESKFNIYIQYSKNIHSEAFIKKRLHAIFGNQILTIVTNIEEADLIISDCIELTDYSKQEFFYFNFTYDIDTWTQLTNYIQKKIMTLAFNV